MLGELDLPLSPSIWTLSDFPGVPFLSDDLLYDVFSWLFDLLNLLSWFF